MLSLYSCHLRSACLNMKTTKAGAWSWTVSVGTCLTAEWTGSAPFGSSVECEYFILSQTHKPTRRLLPNYMWKTWTHLEYLHVNISVVFIIWFGDIAFFTSKDRFRALLITDWVTLSLMQVRASSKYYSILIGWSWIFCNWGHVPSITQYWLVVTVHYTAGWAMSWRTCWGRCSYWRKASTHVGIAGPTATAVTAWCRWDRSAWWVLPWSIPHGSSLGASSCIVIYRNIWESTI